MLLHTTTAVWWMTSLSVCFVFWVYCALIANGPAESRQGPPFLRDLSSELGRCLHICVTGSAKVGTPTRNNKSKWSACESTWRHLFSYMIYNSFVHSSYPYKITKVVVLRCRKRSIWSTTSIDQHFQHVKLNPNLTRFKITATFIFSL